jgi:hypothetical protein
MRPIAVFYHTLFFRDAEFLPSALTITCQQMHLLEYSGLASFAKEIHIGINGGEESRAFASMLPMKANLTFHGLQSKAENLTICELEKWAPSHPGWNVLYFHCKGGTHAPGDNYGDNVSKPWREMMMRKLVSNWAQCVGDLENGFESVGCQFLRGMCDGSQNIWAGNFWWATSDFLRTLPSIRLRDRIRISGIGAAESRFEAEVWIGNGPRLPKVREYIPNWFSIQKSRIILPWQRPQK